MASRPISPAGPPKKHPPPVQPNAHPYAIKTTSSALLSRSNSSPHSAHYTRHHYIPPPPSHVLTGTKVRHRHSSSLPSVEGEMHSVNGTCTIPTPFPPPIVVPSASLKPADEPRHTQRARRIDTMPGSATEPITEDHTYDQKHEFSHDQDSRPVPYVGLPRNPKQWNTDQLTTYLETSFKSGTIINGDKDDPGFADILECVRSRGLTGRELLRLTDGDLAGTSLSDVQRTELLERSRTLRADVLRGRIYVDSYHSHEISDNSNNIYSRSVRSSTPFHSIHGASVSADDLRLLFDDSTTVGGDALIPSPVMSLHRSNSVSDASAQRYRDLARMRMRRRGRVKGLVASWERASTSGSECSASEAGSESETDPESASISDTNSSEPPSNLPPTLSHNVSSPVADLPILPHDPPSFSPPPPYTHMHSKLESMGVEDEEPSIEELLAASSDTPLTGARAWEADFGLGDTVKRVPISLSAGAGAPLAPVMESETSRPEDDGQPAKSDSLSSKGSEMRRSTGSRGKNTKARKRVVTAIFTGSPSSDDLSETAHSRGQHRYASGANGVVRDEVPASLDLQSDSDLRALEESIAATCAQLEVFKLRLERVEADTTRQEMLMRAQSPDSVHSSDVGLKRRHPGTNEQATIKIAEPPRDKISVEGAENRDALESWETMSPTHIAHAIVAKTMGWLFPYGHLGVQVPEEQASTGFRPEVEDKCRSPTKRGGQIPLARLSCNIILVSFAICAAVLRRTGLGPWVRRP